MKIDLPLVHRGKVRDVYQIDEQHLLMVASDRISAFDVILPDLIPNKGALLTQISNFWFDKTEHIIRNHLTNIPVTEVIANADFDLQARAVVVKRLKSLPVEAIVRGYLIGSGWKDYQQTGQLCGIQLAAGMQQAEKFPQPIFTPSTKAKVGDHDENISVEQMQQLIGKDLSDQIIHATTEIYRFAAQHVSAQGLIIADTKLEFGLNQDNQLVLMDEILTPDSSRFWQQSAYKIGQSPESFDKQFLRDYLETLDWNKTAPGPHLPKQITDKTAEKYHEAYTKITGQPFKFDSSTV